jgi:hypothetical protein
MSLKYLLLLPVVGGLFGPAIVARAATVFADNFATSTLNSATPTAPSTAATAYHLFSSKSWSPAPAIAANDLKFGIAATTSGHIEAQALFSATPIALTTVGDFVELTITFTNTTGLFTQAGHVGFGLYNSGGAAPLAGGLNSTAANTTSNLVGGALGWKGYVARLAYSGGNHRLATRPAQSSDFGNNLDLVTEGSGSQSYTGAVNLVTAASTFTQAAGSELTKTLRITLTAANIFQIESKLFSGAGTNDSLLLSQTAAASGANFLTNSFDALAIGWRATANTTATLINIKSITVNSSLPGGPGNTVAGLYFQQQPTDAIAGTTLVPAVTVVATNFAGDPVTNTSVSLSLLNGSTPLNGTLSQLTDASGMATFNNLNLTTVGTKQLRASSGSFTADSAAFTITNAPASVLVFTTSPTDAGISNLIAPPVVVQLRDAYGNNVASNATISLTLSSGTGTLSGTTSLATDATGQSTFTNLSINLAGVKQLTAAKSGLPSVASSLFNITNFLGAFPGAFGAGANASGGRGGDVYYVTTLADGGAGSLRTGISGAPAGGRTILFKVSGNIALNSTLTVNKPNITVAGQSAPGDGICIQDQSFNIAANNIIVRHLRTRLGTNDLAEADGMWINGGTNIIVDHVSASWSVDETLSTSRAVANLTVQNCFITESLKNSIHEKGEHGYGGIISAETDVTFTYHHNLYAHNSSRNPRVGSDSQAGTLRLDFRNNVVYDWGFYAGYSGDINENVDINYVSNYFVAGPITTQTKAFVGGATTTRIYQSGNFIDNDKDLLFDGSNTGWGMFGGTMTQLAVPLDVPAMPTDSAPVALQRVMAQAGAMPWRRDAIDQRIVASVRNHTGTTIDFINPTTFPGDYITNNGSIGVNPWPTLASETAPTDTDNDGMPNYWELAVGLNPNNAVDRNNTDVSSYTELEVYLNWLADAHALCARNGSVDVNLRTATGGATNLTYSVANSANGTASLLGDGFTARFTAAANTNGVANFTFIATGDGITFGPMSYGILITTTNAPTSNTAPTLAAITNRTAVAGTTISFTNSASDSDVPAQALAFSLQNGPSGSSVNSSNGIFVWRPTIAQSPTTNLISVIVTDNGTPNLSTTQSFTIFVTRPVTPALQSVSLAGGTFQFQVAGDAGPDYTIQASTNLVNWSPLFTTNSPALPFNWSDSNAASFNQRYFRVLLGP